MAEETNEPKETQEQTIDEKMDAVLDAREKEAPEESSPSNADTTKPETTDEAGADQPEKAIDGELKDKVEKEAKEPDPKDLMFRKGYNEAKSKLQAEMDSIKGELEQFRKVTSSRDYVEQAMKAQGYKQEAIDSELTKRGFEVKSKPSDDVQLVLDKLGLDPKSVDENTRATISDIAKIANVLFEDRLGKVLPNTLKPLQDNLNNIQRKENATKLTSDMKTVVQREGILDFAKDVEKPLSEWIDANPKATQEEIFKAFETLNHTLTVERLRAGKKTVDRSDKKKDLRTLRPTGADNSLPKKTGDFNEDADAFFDAIGYNQ